MPGTRATILPVMRGRELVCSTELACPVCGNPVYGVAPRSGEVWLRCERKTCRAHFLTLVLQPYTYGSYFLDWLGADRGRALLERIRPDAAQLPNDSLASLRLTGLDRVYIHIPVEGRVKHLHKWDALPALLSTLHVV